MRAGVSFGENTGRKPMCVAPSFSMSSSWRPSVVSTLRIRLQAELSHFWYYGICAGPMP